MVRSAGGADGVVRVFHEELRWAEVGDAGDALGDFVEALEREPDEIVRRGR